MPPEDAAFTPATLFLYPPMIDIPFRLGNNYIDTMDLSMPPEPEDVAAAIVEELVVSTLGRKAISVLALITGRLCARFDVEPETVVHVIRQSDRAERLFLSSQS